MPFKGTEKKSHLHIWPLQCFKAKMCKQKSMEILSAELDLECMSVMEAAHLFLKISFSKDPVIDGGVIIDLPFACCFSIFCLLCNCIAACSVIQGALTQGTSCRASELSSALTWFYCAACQAQCKKVHTSLEANPSAA